jgi:hypothetical protein
MESNKRVGKLEDSGEVGEAGVDGCETMEGEGDTRA